MNGHILLSPCFWRVIFVDFSEIYLYFSQMKHQLHPTEGLALFADLSENVHKEFALAAHVRELGRGEPVFFHADPATSFFVVARGAVRVHRQTPQGKEVTLCIAAAGDMLADQELFEGKSSYQANATAAEDCLVLEYSTRWVRDKMREQPKLALNMLASVSRKNTRTAIDKEHLFTLNASQRVGCFLMHSCNLHHLDPQHFILPYSKAAIASKLGMEPESFSRALARLKEIGVVVSGNEVAISDLARLDEYVCGSCSISEDCETCHNLSAYCAQEKRA